MDLLVVGANGLLGSNVVSAARERGWSVAGTVHATWPDVPISLTRFDLEDAAAFDAVLDGHDPEVVINCAAMTDVDSCEQRPDLAHRVNGEAPGELAAHCERAGVAFVHISTDYVFDGTSRDPYGEAAEPNPIQVYGESKLAGERRVREAADGPLLARLSFVWGVHRARGTLTGFPAWVGSQLESGEDVPLFTDQWVTPTRAGAAAETVLDLLEADASGTYHVACRDCVTPFRFGKTLAPHFGAKPESLVESSLGDVERPATRPRYSCLDTRKTESILDRPQPSLRDDVEAVGEAL